MILRHPVTAVRQLAAAFDAALRRALGLPPRSVVVYAIRCPHCREWVDSRDFDLPRMACRLCVATLGRPRRMRGLMW